ncbi:helix-turn-helix domain-containing protein [Streptomyces sp. NPDC046977]|uniref:helix-turn-helix domain-containing protein n=1 Tax=Streptomyces sp. NPDC046977 TaxID=3154703 RepID=UPI00340D00BE
MDDDTDPRIVMWGPACEAVARLLSPYAEVVLHNVTEEHVLAVWNPVTPRTTGDRVLPGELPAAPVSSGKEVHGPWERLLPDGRRLSSVSAVLRDRDGTPSAVLCVHLDRTPFNQAAALLASFAAPAAAPRVEGSLEREWTRQVDQVIAFHTRDRGRPVERLDRDDRIAILSALHQAGVFARRGAVPVVAAALGTSRSTVYALLAELKDDERPTPTP